MACPKLKANMYAEVENNFQILLNAKMLSTSFENKLVIKKIRVQLER